MTAEAAERLETVANRREDESATEFVLRVADMLEAADDDDDDDDDDPGADVRESNSDIPEDVLTERHISDIANAVSRQTATELETRLR